MKRVFISHPLKGDYGGNRKKVDEIAKLIHSLGYLPLSPIHSFWFMEKESPEERGEILNICCDLIHLADEVWVFGDSEGCLVEAVYANSIGTPVYLAKFEDKEINLGYF